MLIECTFANTHLLVNSLCICIKLIQNANQYLDYLRILDLPTNTLPSPPLSNPLPQPNAKPQSTFCLVHANVKVATSNLKRKFVLEITAQFGEQFYLQADNQKMMDDWYIGIYRAIENAVRLWV